MKQNISDLAVFGGSQAFNEPLLVGKPNIGDREALLNRFNDMLDRRWFSNNGPFALEFEERLADYLGVAHCVAVCNATLGLEIAIQATGMEGEVIVPSFTFVASAHALQWQGIKPVFCDIDPETHVLDPSQIEQLITSKTTGILGVHVWGQACDVDKLNEISSRHNLHLIFDAAHAFGCSYQGQKLGRFGEAEVFSFHATKFLNSFEGGAITTNSDELAEKMRFMRNFGFAGVDKVVHLGTNAKLTEVCAAMGLVSLDSVDDLIAVNKQNYLCYREGLSGLDSLRLYEYSSAEQSNYQYIVLEIQEDSPVSRDTLVDTLHAENVIARRYFYPGCHEMEPYATLYPEAKHHLPVTRSLCNRVMILPTGTSVSKNDIDIICSIIRAALKISDPRQHFINMK